MSLKQWKQRTDSSLNTFFHIKGLQVTYSMSPNQTNSAKQNMLHPGLGVHRRRKKCTQCICMEFHPAPQESMCVHPKGPQVCRCGHHVGRHLFMKGKKGNLNRLTWREKINEATQVPVTELLVRSLERSDARHGKYSKRRSGTRMEHCSYRYSVFFDMIPLLMSSIESYLSNKPKQCILKNQIVEI